MDSCLEKKVVTKLGRKNANVSLKKLVRGEKG